MRIDPGVHEGAGEEDSDLLSLTFNKAQKTVLRRSADPDTNWKNAKVFVAQVAKDVLLDSYEELTTLLCRRTALRDVDVSAPYTEQTYQILLGLEEQISRGKPRPLPIPWTTRRTSTPARPGGLPSCAIPRRTRKRIG